VANPTTQVQTVASTFDELDKYWPMNPADLTTYYTGEMIGVRMDTGYAFHFDDTAPMYFLGVVAGPRKLQQSDTPAEDFKIRYRRPRFLGIPVAATGSFPNVHPSLPTCMETPVYAANSGAVQVGTSSGLVNGNLVGYVADILSVSPFDLVSSQSPDMIWVSPTDFDERAIYHGYLLGAATGAQTLGQQHLNKVFVVPNTASLTLTLPPLNTTIPGDRVQIVSPTSGAGNVVTVAASGADKINGAASVNMTGAAYTTLEVMALDIATYGWLVINKI
jgi:hypothetical protein